MKLVLGLAAVVALVAPASAEAAKPRAKVRTITGQVMAAPYASGKRVVVPVLVDGRSARRAKLRAPAGVLMLKGAKRVAVRGQRARVAPALLRAGDRLRARARVTRGVRRATYWRMPARKFTLTKRSPTFGPAELQTVLAGFGGDIRRLDTALTGLAQYVQGGFQALTGEIAGLRGQLGRLTVALGALEQRVAALEAGLPALEARLQGQLDALQGDFDSMQAQLAALQSQLGTLQADIGALDGQLDAAGGDLAAVQTAVGQLSTDVSELQSSVGALCGAGSPVGGLC